MNLWTAVENGAINAANAALKAIENLINFTINGINRVIDLANNMPGVNLGKVGTVSFSKIAGGNKPMAGLGFGDIFAARVAVQSESGLQSKVRNAHDRATMGNAVNNALGGGGGRTRPRPSGGGGGGRKRGGGGQSDTAKLQEQFNKELATTREKLNAIKAEFTDMENYGFKNQFTTLREFNAELEKAGGRYSKFDPETQIPQIRKVMEQIHAQEQLNAVQAFHLDGNTLGDFVATGKANFRDMTVSILQDLSKIFIRMTTMRLVSSFAGGGGAFADGGAFNNGLQFFASGGVFTNQVVSRPTMFAHGGGFGVMGEAGPEAIMPLTRAPNGKLGVAAQGGSGVQNNVNISVSISQTGNAESDSKADSEQGRRIARMLDGKIIEVLAREIPFFIE